MANEIKYLSLEELNRIPWLIHGFGLAGFKRKISKLIQS